ncbi:uncharacterized protein LOC115469558 isoform X3 [Microcaecilia unicolor]|uniref:Uncharacterized protein LOC115469558 isoform X3 n=1 Tax=Microcaecilia unicolor TaxID=1415580 RepID=A0A6P7XS23_9AMPH|nr:uncharacterized protein LOC115469558 isoform X3 [Microcaecilia unicolor]
MQAGTSKTMSQEVFSPAQESTSLSSGTLFHKRQLVTEIVQSPNSQSTLQTMKALMSPREEGVLRLDTAPGEGGGADCLASGIPVEQKGKDTKLQHCHIIETDGDRLFTQDNCSVPTSGEEEQGVEKSIELTCMERLQEKQKPAGFQLQEHSKGALIEAAVSGDQLSSAVQLGSEQVCPRGQDGQEEESGEVSVQSAVKVAGDLLGYGSQDMENQQEKEEREQELHGMEQDIGPIAQSRLAFQSRFCDNTRIKEYCPRNVQYRTQSMDEDSDSCDDTTVLFSLPSKASKDWGP